MRGTHLPFVADIVGVPPPPARISTAQPFFAPPVFLRLMKSLAALLFAAGAAFTGAAATAAAVPPPAPIAPVPTEAQLRWHETETFSLIHYGLNTYTNREWGFGNESPSLFNPARFDANQIAGALKTGGMNGLILVAKHHDGFCLWPTKTTPHNITLAPFRDGKGDVVREFADATRAAGLRFGIYCSPWDRNHPEYARAGYVKTYHAQLLELLTNYGELFEFWFDGANGGDGYYGGAKGGKGERRSINAATYYGWREIFALVKKHQPGAVIFSDVGPGSRWVGNEHGYAAPESWPTLTPAAPKSKRVAVGENKFKEVANNAAGGAGDDAANVPTPGNCDWSRNPTGERFGKQWLPAECDVPMRAGWFWHPGKKEERRRPPAKLMDIYFSSVGRGGALNLGIAPDRDGLVCDHDLKTLTTFGNALRATFAKNLAAGATATASNTRGEQGDNAGYLPKNVLDGDRYSYWATDDGVTTGELTLTLPAPVEFNVVRLRENIKLGHRVGKFVVEARVDGEWREVFAGEAIAACRLHWQKDKPIRADAVRLRVLEARGPLAISEFGIYRMPKL